jgi:uncharacterized membrane protein YcaP (DUF421 family)
VPALDVSRALPHDLVGPSAAFDVHCALTARRRRRAERGLANARAEDCMDFLIPEVSVMEKIVRCAIVYAFLLVVFRVMGKRQLGHMTAFDLIVLLIISELVQNAMIGNDNSVTGGLISVTTLVLMNAGVAWVTYRYKPAERLVEHAPTILVRHGRVLWDNVRREHMTPAEFRSALRRNGVASLHHVRFVLLEEDGHLSVIRKEPESN